MLSARVGFSVNFITAFMFFAYAFTHTIDGQMKIYFWLALLLTSAVSFTASYLSTTRKYLVLVFCSLPFFGMINFFMLPSNLNLEFIQAFSAPTIVVLFLQVVFCKIFSLKREGTPDS